MRLGTGMTGRDLAVGGLLLAVLLIPGAIASAIGGPSASMALGISAGCGLAAGSVLPPRRSLVLVLLLGLVAAAGVVASGQPVAAGVVVAATVLATGAANGWSAGSYALAPVLAVVFAAADRGLPWWSAAAWSVAGGVIGLLVLRVLKVSADPQPLAPRHAWRHAGVLAAAAGVTLALALWSDVPHGYWVTVTLIVALRPLPAERTQILADRLWGTLIGAAIAVTAVVVLPDPWPLVVAAVCLLLVAGYGVSRHYLLQTVFLTPMLLLFATAGDDESAVAFTGQRIVYTVGGVLVGAALVALLSWWDARDRPE